MSMLAIVLISAVCLLTAYFTYGKLLARLLRLRPDVATPAVELRDDVDYAPIEPKFLLSQHFSAIAAAGPIVGPILAGIYFGWLPALIWILVGAVFIGGVHDMTALVASIRHKARSIAEVVRDHMSQRSYILFLSFVWLALVYIIVAFTDVTATSFLGLQTLENGQVILGGGTATSSLLYLILPIVMGLLLRYTKLSIGWATVIFLPLVGASIWIGQDLPFQSENLFGLKEFSATELPQAVAETERILTPEQMQAFHRRAPHPRQVFQLADKKFTDAVLTDSLALSPDQAGQIQAALEKPLVSYNQIMSNTQRGWNFALLVYCVIASVVPMWLLLQPRGHLGGYFLYVVLIAGGLGIAFGGKAIQYPAFLGFEVLNQQGSVITLFPILFITIACGACSGFHSIIASGTTSKQLKCEPDARVVGYGAMLLEAMVAIVSLCCVMMLDAKNPDLKRGPNFLYASGIGSFMTIFGVPAAFGVSFGLMAFTTFVYDTLDVCTRLGRYILQELTGATGPVGRWVATGLTAGVPLIFLMWQPVDAQGKMVERWRIFWDLFGASNQLLAALTLLGVTVWLWRTYRARWVLAVTGIPCVFMYVMSMWALVRILWPLTSGGALTNPVPWVALILASLGALMLVEALRIVLSGLRRPPAPGREPVAIPT